MFRQKIRHSSFTLACSIALSFASASAFAIELPPPTELEKLTTVLPQTIKVIEPHESRKDKQVLVSYVGLPLNELVTQWFGDELKAGDGEFVFFAQDGYRSVVPASYLKKFRAYLAFARADGAAFTVGNPGQNEKSVALGPYYLIWDNQNSPELLQNGAYGWPYQVVRVEYHRNSEGRNFLPPNASPDAVQGSADTREYCLTCHHIAGLGGSKYAEDLAKAVGRWTDSDLISWIDDPNRIRPGTNMPPLNRMLPTEVRRRTIERIVTYLRAIKH